MSEYDQQGPSTSRKRIASSPINSDSELQEIKETFKLMQQEQREFNKKQQEFNEKFLEKIDRLEGNSDISSTSGWRTIQHLDFTETEMLSELQREQKLQWSMIDDLSKKVKEVERRGPENISIIVIQCDREFKLEMKSYDTIWDIKTKFDDEHGYYSYPNKKKKNYF